MRLVDLSHPLVSGMPVYPGDPEVTVEPALTVASDGVAVARLDLGSHAGTHLDAPAHSIIGGATVDEIPLELLTGEAVVLRVGPEHARPGEVFGIDRIAGGVPDRLPRIVLIAAGWDAHFGTEQGLRHPSLAPELAELLWERGARVLGVDVLSPDATDGAAPAGGSVGAGGASAADTEELGAAPAGMPVHEFWLGRGGVIVENLTRLTELPATVQVSLLPLRIAGGDGSPIRAIAWVDEGREER